MSFIMKWGTDDILRQLRYCSAQMNSPYNDGFTGWACKKDLLTIQYELNELLRKSPNFSNVEDEFLEEQQKKHAWKVLNEKTSK